MKNFNQFNLINESKMFDNMDMLLQHGEQYIINFPNKSLKWTQHLNEIFREDIRYISMAFSIDELNSLVNRELKILESFLNDISSYINELDDIYKTNQQLSEEDNNSYDELENLKDNFDFNFTKIEDYINELSKLSKTYRTLDHQINVCKTFKFVD